LEKDVLAELELYLIHPIKGRIQYGTLSTLINGLLRQMFTHLHKPGVDPVKVFRAYGVDIATGDESSQTENHDAT